VYCKNRIENAFRDAFKIYNIRNLLLSSKGEISFAIIIWRIVRSFNPT
jgi:hypothetical protein